MSYSVDYISPRNALLTRLPGVAKYGSTAINIEHKHSLEPLTSYTNKDQLIKFQTTLSLDIDLYQSALPKIKAAYEEGTINKKTKNQALKIFELAIESDERFLELTKKALDSFSK